MPKLNYWFRRTLATSSVVAAIVSLFAIIGCSTAKMAVAPALSAASETIPVNRPTYSSSLAAQTWSLGAYTAKEVDMGWTQSESGDVNGFKMSKAAQRFSYELLDASATGWKATCEIVSNEKRMELVYGIARSWLTKTLTCSFAGPGRVEVATLKAVVTEDRNDAQTVGSMKVGDEELSLILSMQKEGVGLSMLWATGFIFRNADSTLGAVDIMNQGIVYLGKSIDESTRFSLAAASVALIIFGTKLSSL